MARSGMDHLQQSLPESKKRPASIVGLYDSFSSGKFIQDCFRRIRDNSRQVFTTSFWKVDLLDFPNMRDIAALEAAQADVLVFVVPPESELTFATELWLEKAVSLRPDSKKDIVLLFDGPRGRTEARPAAEIFLRRFARKNGMTQATDYIDLKEASDQLFECNKLMTILENIVRQQHLSQR